jgi:hypothetical protein
LFGGGCLGYGADRQWCPRCPRDRATGGTHCLAARERGRLSSSKRSRRKGVDPRERRQVRRGRAPARFWHERISRPARCTGASHEATDTGFLTCAQRHLNVSKLYLRCGSNSPPARRPLFPARSSIDAQSAESVTAQRHFLDRVRTRFPVQAQPQQIMKLLLGCHRRLYLRHPPKTAKNQFLRHHRDAVGAMHTARCAGASVSVVGGVTS